MDTVISWSVENVITIFLMVVVGWLILSFATSYIGSRA